MYFTIVSNEKDLLTRFHYYQHVLNIGAYAESLSINGFFNIIDPDLKISGNANDLAYSAEAENIYIV